MTAQYESMVADDPLLDPAAALDAAREHITARALRPSGVGTVGLELEYHLVELARPELRPSWDQVLELVAGVPALPSASSVTLEPGGQVELSTPPEPDITSSVRALQADEQALRAALRGAGFGLAALGTDPARPSRRVNPAPRYVAMEEHFAAVGCLRDGRTMMTSTAALQVNLDAGPQAGWAARLELIRDLGPVFVAASGCSPYLAGRTSGWASMRQQAWHGIDHSRSDPVDGVDPSEAWASYALDAPVMLVRDGDAATALTTRVPFSAWLRGDATIVRRPTIADLDYHLTTLFPPIRPRGYVEIRCVDALPARWWPALAAFVAVLVDVPAAASAAADLAAPVRSSWLAAARDGLRDPGLRRAVNGCAEVVAAHAPDGLRAEVDALAALLTSGRTPGDEVRACADARGPVAALAEAARND